MNNSVKTCPNTSDGPGTAGRFKNIAAILSATFLATAARNDAVGQAVDQAVRQTALVATTLATAAEERTITKAGRLATIAKDEAISHSTLALSVVQNKLSNAIPDMAAGQNKILEKMNPVNAGSANFCFTVFARLFPYETPSTRGVSISGSNITATNQEGRETHFTFKSVAVADTKNKWFSTGFLKPATDVLEGRSHLLILLGDSGTGRTFTSTGPDALLPMVLGRIICDIADTEWTTITLEAKEYSASGEHSLAGGLRTTDTTAIDPDWLATCLPSSTTTFLACSEGGGFGHVLGVFGVFGVAHLYLVGIK